MSDAYKICPKCGEEASLSAYDCTACGHKFRTIFTLPPGHSAPPIPQQIQEPVRVSPALASRETVPFPSLIVETLPPQRANQAYLVHLAWIIPLLGLCIWGLIYWASGGSLSRSPSGMSAQPLTPLTLPAGNTGFNAPVEISSYRLDQEYESNQVAADKKYKGNLLSVMGPIREIDRAPEGSSFVSLSGRNATSRVICVFEEGTESGLAALKLGSKIKISGVCTGTPNGTVTLNTCTIAGG